MLDLSDGDFTTRGPSCQVDSEIIVDRRKMATRSGTGWRQQFGERLVEAIDRASLTRRSFAERIGVSEGAVSRWVNGRTDPSLPLLPRIALVLGVTLDWLLGTPSAPGPPQVPKPIDPRAVRRAIKKLAEIRGVIDQLADALPDDEE